MIVVSNTSPLTNLACIGRFDLLRDLFGCILIAPGVKDELTAQGRAWPGAAETQAADWITQQTPSNAPLIASLRTQLDKGEAETIALAVEVQAGLCLLDERDGRHIAQAQGLRIMGVVGVLIAAKHSGLIPALRPELDHLRNRAGFYLGNEVYTQALASVQED
ncbi:MAG: DUF3368 domain-containing protein [Gammaproteobacteria bacterium SHHR-1]